MGLKVAIIGGGPSGTAAARALLAEKPAVDIELFEARSSFGGLWNYSPTAGPMYHNMDANVPRNLISFTGFPFPEGDGYPSRQEVLKYLQKYATEVTRSLNINVRFNTKVQRLIKSGEKWKIETNDNETLLFDRVLLATGHYEFPYWPPVPGLKQHPGAIHSVDYDRVDEFSGKKVLIVGNARSGTDLAIQLLSVTAPISVSRRAVGPSDGVFDEDPTAVIWKPQVSKVVGQRVYFEDDTHETYDRIISSTGYLYEFPFLELPDDAPLHHKSRLRFQNIYKHTFYSADPTLATIAINKGMVPFPTMETQAAVIARVWTSRIQLPSLEEMNEEETKIAASHGSGDKFHELSMQQDIEFMEDLWDWADQAPEGFLAERWSPHKLELRNNAGKLKETDYRAKVVRAKLHREARSEAVEV